MHRLLDLEIDAPQVGEEYFVENPNWGRYGGKWLLRRLCYEPEPEEETAESPRGYRWPLASRDWMEVAREGGPERSCRVSSHRPSCAERQSLPETNNLAET